MKNKPSTSLEELIAFGKNTYPSVVGIENLARQAIQQASTSVNPTKTQAPLSSPSNKPINEDMSRF